MDSSGAYQWHTFYGCYFYDYGFSIALDGNGNVYVTGNSDTSWNGPSDEPPLHAYSTTWGLIFVLKLDSSGAYQWHIFYGYASMESGDSIAVDGSGNVYVTGYSNASWNGSSGEPPLHAYSGSMYDIFILKLNSSGAYQWHTFYGSDTFYFSIIKVDGSGNVYLTGESRASWNGPSGEAPLRAYSGDNDIFVLKLTQFSICVDFTGALLPPAYAYSPQSDIGTVTVTTFLRQLYLDRHK